ncbi:MAG: hypothetical protein V8T36_11045 [Ruthenibacterium lactatiformans]
MTQHVANSVNTFSCVEEWDATYGKVYKTSSTTGWMPSWPGISCCRSTRVP